MPQTAHGSLATKPDADIGRNCVVARCAILGLEIGIDLAKVMSSDAHTLNAFSSNTSGNRRLTRLKMEALTFASLRIALNDAAARVRLEDLIPASVPRFVGMKLEGGFLKDQVVHFSANLTCIIGGRGAGKSTLLESLRAASGNAAESTIIDSEVWPDAISLVYEDEVSKRHTLTRSKLCEVVNGDPDGPTAINIESYGQGETADTIQHCDEDPSILLRFLDGFIDFGEMRKRGRSSARRDSRQPDRYWSFIFSRASTRSAPLRKRRASPTRRWQP